MQREAGVAGRLLGHGVLDGIVPPLWEVRPEDFPLAGEVLEHAAKPGGGLVAHSRYVAERAVAAGYDGRLWRIQHPAWPDPGVPAADVAGDPVVGCFGNLNASKRIPQLLEAFAALRQKHANARLLLVDTGKRHDLSAGGLNERRAECEAAVKRLKVELPELLWLASWPAEWLPRLKRALREPLRSRAVHVVSETARTRFAAQLLQQRKLKQFGKLLYESHESCRRLYECSSPELDTVVAAAKRAGALGARLTGAGWGGAAIVLVNKTDKTTIPAIQRAYERAYGRSAPISEVKASAGAHTERI